MSKISELNKHYLYSLCNMQKIQAEKIKSIYAEAQMLFHIAKRLLLYDLLAERTIIVEEALAGLNAQPAGTNHLTHQRMRTVLRVAGLAVQRLHDCEVYIVANKVSGVQRAGLHACAKLHSNVDISRGSDALSATIPIASFIIGIRMRFTTKPGPSLTAIGSCPGMPSGQMRSGRFRPKSGSRG